MSYLIKYVLNHRLVLLILFCIAAVSTLQASKTFFMPRSLQTDLTIFNATSTMFQNQHEAADRFNFSATTFYQESTNGRDLARYFLIGGKNELVIKGANAPGDRDISATWLQIAGKNDAGVLTRFMDSGGPEDEELYFNQFQSKISIHPNYKRFGQMLRFFKYFGKCERYWIDLTIPFIQVQTNLHLREYDIQSSADSLENIDNFVINETPGIPSRKERPTQSTMLNAANALNNPNWKYGKFKQGSQKIAGLSDITFKLGFRPIHNNTIMLDMYANLIFPASHKPKSEYVFEPILGNGKHFGLGGGLSFDYELLCSKRFAIQFLSNLEYAYLFRNTQLRSFDLNSNGEWSRYLLVFSPNKAIDVENRTPPTPGINIFTDRLNVTPGSEINWTNKIQTKVASVELSLGYNLWWRAKEQVQLKELWNKQVSIMHFASFPDGVDPVEMHPFALESFSQATIQKDYIGQPGNITDGSDGFESQILVNPANLNINSAAHQKVIAHKIYGTLGYSFIWAQQPTNIEFGASYQVSNSRETIRDWCTWLQLSLAI